MRSKGRIALCLLALMVPVGCAKTTVTEQTPMSSPGVARPSRILVYSFVADPADMPTDSSIAGAVSAPRTPPTAEQLATGRQLGTLIAADLVADIQASVTVWFAPKAAPGQETNWVQTMPGKGWNTLLRLYAPLELGSTRRGSRGISSGWTEGLVI